MPLISIIVTVFNSEEYLRECLNSILNQSFDSFEVVIVDDGSSDSSSVICKEYEKLDKRFRLYELRKNVGISAARNFALSKCRGQYLIFVDSDDYVSPEYLSSLYQIAVTHSCDVACCNYYILEDFNNHSLKISGLNLQSKVQITKQDFIQLIFSLDASKKLDIGISGYLWNKLIKRECCNGTFFKKIGAEDEVFLVETISNIDTIMYCGTPLYYYRVRKNSLSHSSHFTFKLLESRVHVYNIFKTSPIQLIAGSALHQSLLGTLKLTLETGSLSITDIKKLKEILNVQYKYSKDLLYTKGYKLCFMQVIVFCLRIFPDRLFQLIYSFASVLYRLVYSFPFYIR